jgi:membrane-bound ClpP family serine protease
MAAGTIVLIVVLLLAAMALIVAEICTPFIGLLGASAVGLTGLAIYLAWTVQPLFGLVMGVCCIIGLPVYTVIVVKKLPGTSLGRRLHLYRGDVPAGEGTPESESLGHLVGRRTTAETTLRPAGTVRVDGRRIVAQAESGMIEKGLEVTIIRAAGNRVFVRKSEQQS